MGGSTMKGFEFIDSSVASDIPRHREFSRICVEGFDTSLYAYDVELALRKHFSSCGEVTYVNVPRYSLMHIDGEGALEKALQLSGSDVVGAGWRVFVKESPMPSGGINRDPHTAESIKHARSERTIVVRGFDTSLPKIDLQIGLSKYFSSCGEVHYVSVHLTRTAHILIRGDGAVEKALELCGRDVGGWNITVVRVLPHLNQNFPTSNRAPPSLLRDFSQMNWKPKKNEKTTE